MRLCMPRKHGVRTSLVPSPRMPPGDSLVNEVKFLGQWIFNLYSSICTSFEQAWCKMLWILPGDTVAKVCNSPRKLTWFTRPFLLVRRWGLGMRLSTNNLLCSWLLCNCWWTTHVRKRTEECCRHVLCSKDWLFIGLSGKLSRVCHESHANIEEDAILHEISSQLYCETMCTKLCWL